MHVSRKGRQTLALGAGVTALLALVTPAGFATSSAAVDYGIAKAASTTAPTVGTPFTYTLTASLVSGVPTVPATVTDVLPTAVAFQSASTGCGFDAATHTVTCAANFVPPTPATPQVFTVTVVPVTASATPVANTATIAPSTGADTDGVTGNNTSPSAPVTIGGTSLTCFGSAPTIVGTTGNDTITGTPGNDVIMGLGGDDTIDGGAGDDKICGGDGNDHLYGGLGNDSLAGGQGSDIVDGGAGSNTLRGDGDTVQQGPWPGGNHRRHGRYDRNGRDGRNGHDTLICQHQLDTCDGGFGGGGGDHRGRGNNDDRVIFVGGDDHNGRYGNHGHHGYHDFAANKGTTPVKPAAKPVAKPLVKPAAKPAPAVAGTAPVAPKA